MPVVFDTNIILNDANNLLTLRPEDILILTETVIDELDAKKSGLTEIAYQAREAGRILAMASIKDQSKHGEHSITTLLLMNNLGEYVRTAWIVSKDTYNAVGESSILNDRKIIEIAVDFKAEFISDDIMAYIRALSEGLQVSRSIKENAVELISFREVEVTSLEGLEYKDVQEVVPDYTPDNMGFLFVTNEGNQKLARVVHGKLVFIDEHDLARQNVTPINREQRVLSSAILSEDYDVIVSNSVAGSGKGLITLSAAMRLVGKKRFQKIYYIRNTVNNLDPEEEVGYLAGNVEKFEMFYAPLMDTLRYMVEDKLKAQKLTPEALEKKVQEGIEAMISKYQIEAMSTLGLRGRTLRGFIWVDEAQNLSVSSMQTLMTRIGKGSMVVVTGDQSQIDHQYINKHNNGLAVLLAATKSAHNSINIFAITLVHVVRGAITEWAGLVFNKKERN